MILAFLNLLPPRTLDRSKNLTLLDLVPLSPLSRWIKLNFDVCIRDDDAIVSIVVATVMASFFMLMQNT